MKKTLLLTLSALAVFASSVEVKRDKVVVEVNGESQFLLKGDTITLNKNDEICIIKGKGKLVINNEIQISAKSRNKCYKSLDGSDMKSESIAATAQSYLDSSEDSVSGMSRGLKQDDDDK